MTIEAGQAPDDRPFLTRLLEPASIEEQAPVAPLADISRRMIAHDGPRAASGMKRSRASGDCISRRIPMRMPSAPYVVPVG